LELCSGAVFHYQPKLPFLLVDLDPELVPVD